MPEMETVMLDDMDDYPSPRSKDVTALICRGDAPAQLGAPSRHAARTPQD
jgi:hypothetical protein